MIVIVIGIGIREFSGKETSVISGQSKYLRKVFELIVSGNSKGSWILGIHGPVTVGDSPYGDILEGG